MIQMGVLDAKNRFEISISHIMENKNASAEGGLVGF
jgi:hypothetical protein